MSVHSADDLQKYVLSDFRDETHLHESLIDIFRRDYPYFLKLRQRHLIRSDAEQFFAECEEQLCSAESISVDAFRRLKYEQILQDYKEQLNRKEQVKKKSPTACKKEAVQKGLNSSSSKQTTVQHKKMQVQSRIVLERHLSMYPKLACPYDLEIMECTSEKLVHQRGQTSPKKKFKIPLYTCEVCGRRYTSTSRYNDMAILTLNKESILNIRNTPVNREGAVLCNFRGQTRKNCYVYGTCKPSRCAVNGCDKELEEITIRVKKKHIVKVEWCPSCGMVYIPLAFFEKYQKLFDCQNTSEVSHLLEIKKQKDEDNKKLQEERKQQAQSAKQTVKNAATTTFSIQLKDFVVRRSVFRCMHNEHRLQNINAVISLINENGNVVQTRVPAGYCPNCNLFFIMESTYEKLKNCGTPVCRVCDEKTYLKGNHYVGGMKLAQESVLMQYGYSVSQQEGLTLARRQKILAVIIDYKILTKSEILSYLDFFINQRQHQPKYESAISKWKEDREFVSAYNQGHYSEYFVNELHRRK